MAANIPDFERSPPVSIQRAPEENARFREAALTDGKKSLGTWLEHLARKRVEELHQRGSLCSKEGGADNP